MLQQTSLLAYDELVRTGVIGNRQAQILKAMIDHPFPVTNSDLVHLTGLPINCVTPRVKELREKGFVQKAYVKKEDRPAIAWKVSYDITL